MMAFSELLSKISQYLLFKQKVYKIEIDRTFRKFYKDQHQLTSTTLQDRYPDLFESSSSVLSGAFGGEVKLLSFGCSTGEECFSLKKYFPAAKIIGTDINKGNLRIARRRNNFNDVHFLYSDFSKLKQEGPYHGVFCLSVLCRWEETEGLDNCERIYPFSKFEEITQQLAELILPGGILVIYNSNFRFEDSAFSTLFESVFTPAITDSGFVHKFDDQNNRIFDKHTTCIYRKKSA